MFVVTVLWSSSFPIHKALLNQGMPPLSLAAYRYALASIILVAVLLSTRRNERATSASPQHNNVTQWLIFLGIGLFMYAAQGIHITALSLIPASDSGLVSMTCMPVAVALLAPLIERTPPTWAQAAGLGVILAGIYVYFPHNMAGIQLAGVLLNVLSSSMWAVAVVLTHIAVNKMRITSLKLTTVSMTAGSAVLLLAALAHDRFYVPGVSQMLWLTFLAAVNTAFGFALYNHIMKRLGAFEIAAFQDSMVIQIGILSAIFLGESISPLMVLGMLLVVVGVAVVQYFAPARRGQEEIPLPRE